MFAAVKRWMTGGGRLPLDPSYLPGSAAALSPDLEAGARSRRLAFFQPAAAHINAAMLNAGPTIQARARWLARNNAYAKNAVEAWSTAAVGAGIKPSSLIEDEDILEAVQDAWNDWTDEADAEDLADFYGMMRRAARECFLVGECFVRFRPRDPGNGLLVPLQLQVLPSEQLPMNSAAEFVPEGYDNEGGAIRMGIEFDRIERNRRVAYWFVRENPTDATAVDFRNLLAANELVRIPADEIIHVYDPLEAGQLRGLTGLSAAITKLFAIDAFDDSEMERQRQQSRYATFITVPERIDNLGNVVNGRPDDMDPFNWTPGQTVQLEGGEDVKFAQPPAVSGTYEAFQYRALLAVAAACGIPYSEITNDLQRTTYASSRAGLVAFRQRVEAFQHSVLVFQFVRRVWQAWMDYAVLARAVPISIQSYNGNWRRWRAMKAVTPRVPWVDPLKDRQAAILGLKAGILSPQDVIEAEGYDLKEVYYRIAEAADLAAELGITVDYGTSGGAAGGGAGVGRSVGTHGVIPTEVDSPAEESAA